MKTKTVIESLLHFNNNNLNLRIALSYIGILNYTDRNWSPVFHKELEEEIKSFEYEKISIISTIATRQKTIIFIPEGKKKTYSAIVIEGNESQITSISKTFMARELDYNLTTADFIPRPFIRKIIGIKNLQYEKDNIAVIVLSEYVMGHWTLEDPFILDPNTKTRVVRTANLLRELMEALC